MVRDRTLTVLLVFGVTACAGGSNSERLPQHISDGELITWETTDPGPFCGSCGTLKVAVASDGRVWLEEGRWTQNRTRWVVSSSQTTAAPQHVALFRAELESIRPSGTLLFRGGEANCPTFVSDSIEIAVTWNDARREDRLIYNFGCGDHEIAQTLRFAPALLQIDELNVD